MAKLRVKPKFKVGDLTTYFQEVDSVRTVHKITGVHEKKGYYMFDTRYIGTNNYHSTDSTFNMRTYDETEIFYEKKIANTKLSRKLYPDAKEESGYLILKGDL